MCPVPFDLSWKHISDLPLADPSFGAPGRIDILLDVDMTYSLQGRIGGGGGLYGPKRLPFDNLAHA